MEGKASHQNEKVSFDPGWNDPPPLSYNLQSQRNKPRNILNKRVAFPLSSAPPQQTVQGIMPPSLPFTVAGSVPQPLTVSPILLQESNVQEDQMIDSDAALKEVIDTLSGILNDSIELETSAGDIRKRITALEESWKNGKLQVQAQSKMLKLATALKEGRAQEAEELHKALAVEHAGSVGTWMPAVRKLIHHSIAKQELLSLDNDD